MWGTLETVIWEPTSTAARLLGGRPRAMGSWFPVLAGSCLAMRQSCLLFHSLVEFFVVLVGCRIFAVVRRARVMGPTHGL